MKRKHPDHYTQTMEELEQQRVQAAETNPFLIAASGEYQLLFIVVF